LPSASSDHSFDLLAKVRIVDGGRNPLRSGGFGVSHDVLQEVHRDEEGITKSMGPIAWQPKDRARCAAIYLWRPFPILLDD
jgi:hypothetical protein